MKGWHSPIVLHIQEEIQFQHFQHLRCLVDQMNGWEDPNEAAGHMMYPMCMLHLIGNGADGFTEMRFIHILR